MNVSLQDQMGLRIYREVMHRENRCAADWHVNYGPEALQRSPDPAMMINLGKFSKFASVPMPLDVQRTRRARHDARHGNYPFYKPSTFGSRVCPLRSLPGVLFLRCPRSS